MRSLTTLLLAGIGALAFASAASAQTVHHMTIRLPDGTVEQIEYAGNVPPRVEILPVTTLDSGLRPFWSSGDPVFAQFQQITAAMDREADAMLRQAEAMLAQSPASEMRRIDTRNLPPGTESYSFTEVLGPNGTCSQSMTISPGPNGRPHVVTHQSGSCGGNGTYVLPGMEPEAPVPAPAPVPGVMSVKAVPPAGAPVPYSAELREAAYQSPRY
jgi:hypothetical protein